MRTYLPILFSILTIQTFGQGDYQHYADIVKKRWTNTEIKLPLQYLDKGIKSMMFYSCNDTIFNEKNCTRTELIYFDAKTSTVLDTIFSGEHFSSQKTEVSREFIRVKETSVVHDTTQSIFQKFTRGSVMGTKIDSLVLNAAKNPLELYEDKRLTTKWTYDSDGRIITKIENIDNVKELTTTTISYQPNTIAVSTEAKSYDEITNSKSLYQFDGKSKLIVKEEIYYGKIKFLYKDKKIHFDSIILSEPFEIARYTIYGYKSSNIQIATFYERDDGKESVIMTVVRKLDKKKRISNQYVLGEKGDTLSYDVYEYSKEKVVKNSYQDNKFFDKTTKYYNSKGQLTKQHKEASDPFIWTITRYNDEILTKEIDVNYDYRKMRIVIVEK